MNQMIHLRIEPELKKQIDIIIKDGYYSTTTDFIKEQIRKGIFEHQRQSAFAKFKGIAHRTMPLTKEERTVIADYLMAHPGETFKRLDLKVSESAKPYQKNRSH